MCTPSSFCECRCSGKSRSLQWIIQMIHRNKLMHWVFGATNWKRKWLGGAPVSQIEEETIGTSKSNYSFSLSTILGTNTSLEWNAIKIPTTKCGFLLQGCWLFFGLIFPLSPDLLRSITNEDKMRSFAMPHDSPTRFVTSSTQFGWWRKGKEENKWMSDYETSDNNIIIRTCWTGLTSIVHVLCPHQFLRL